VDHDQLLEWKGDTMATGMVMDPRAPARAVLNDELAGPTIQSLRGKTVGFRRDVHWHSWDVVTDHWAARIESDGGHVVMWRAGARVGAESIDVAEQLEHFASSVDLAVVGLAN
jgi:hypothetical protein